MGKAQRDKGKAGERELASLVSDLTGWDVRRRVRQHDGDSDLEGIPGWSVECKRHEKATPGKIRAWWEQAVAQATGADIPVLFYRPDYAREWRAVWPMAVLMTEQRSEYWSGYEWTADSSVQAWASVARECHNAKDTLSLTVGKNHAST